MKKRFTLKTLALALSIFLLAPFTSSVLAATDEPTIISEAAIVMDYETGEIIYEKNANEQMYLASTTKLMTALLFAENANKKDNIPYTEDALAQPPYTMNSEQMLPTGKSLKVGDVINADTVMKELLLFSGNDTAVMIADYVAGNTDKFVEMMNDRASKLGLNNTHFENANGLPVNGSDVNYSTAYELALLTKEAYKNEWVRKTMALSETRVTLPGNTIIDLENRNSELGKNGNIGGKTGVTDAAGTCFAGLYERDGKKYVTVVLKCDRHDNNARFVDIKAMMDYSEDAEKVVYKKSGETVGNVELSYKLFRFFGPKKTIKADIKLSEDALIYDNAINKDEAKITFNQGDQNAWQIASDNSVKLKLNIKDYSENLKGEVEISTSQLLKANLGVYLATLAVIIIIVVLVILIIRLIRSSGRNRRRRRRRY